MTRPRPDCSPLPRPLRGVEAKRTIGTYFSGGGLVEVGARAAGFIPVFGVEYDPANPRLSAGIADLYERNIGEHLIRKSVVDIDPAELPAVYWFHASPVCKSFSQANANGKENENDIATAQATAAYITYHRPPFVTIENVWLYRLSESWRIIANALTVAGYLFRVQKVNMADFGVPQSRERMIVTAMPGRMPRALHATHQNPELIQNGQCSMFGQLPAWIGWYEAISDLIPDLKETTPAQWQMKRLPAELREMMLVDPNNPSRDCTVRLESEPCPTVAASWMRRPVNVPLAYLMAVQGENSDYADNGQPAPVIAANHGAGKYRAYLVDSLNAREVQTTRNGREPSLTVIAHSSKHPAPIAHTGGRWVKLNTRCLARFQSVPDDYELSGNNTVDCAVIGNGGPPRFIAEMARQVLR